MRYASSGESVASLNLITDLGYRNNSVFTINPEAIDLLTIIQGNHDTRLFVPLTVRVFISIFEFNFIHFSNLALFNLHLYYNIFSIICKPLF